MQRSLKVSALCFLSIGLFAQPAVPQFEVAAVRRQPSDAQRGGFVRNISPTGITFRNATLGNCVEWAYGFEHLQVFGPAWRDRPTDVTYDIVGKTAEPVPEPQLKLMFQTLLKERLNLAVHREQRELPIYALTLARGGPKFHESATEGEPSVKPAGLQSSKFERVSMAWFGKSIGYPSISRPVIDETGLKGTFDFTLDLSTWFAEVVRDPAGRIDMESIFLLALPQQLGLKLDPRKAPLEVLVIDSAVKDPTAN